MKTILKIPFALLLFLYCCLHSNFLAYANTDLEKAPHILNIVYGNGVYVSVGYIKNYYIIQTSENGQAWIDCDIAKNYNLHTVQFVNGKFFVLGDDVILSSTDGQNWTVTKVTIDAMTIAYGNGIYVVGGEFNTETVEKFLGLYETKVGIIITSNDGINWTQKTIKDVDDVIHQICFENGKFIMSASRNKNNIIKFGDTPEEVAAKKGNPLLSIAVMASSTNGTDWQTQTFDDVVAFYECIYANNTYVAIGNSGIAISTNGTSWEKVTTQHTYQYDNIGNCCLNDIIYTDGKFIAVGDDCIITSTDGRTWTEKVRTSITIKSITKASEGLIAVGNSGEHTSISKSIDNGETWVNINNADMDNINNFIDSNSYKNEGPFGNFTTVVTSGNGYVAGGYYGYITSTTQSQLEQILGIDKVNPAPPVYKMDYTEDYIGIAPVTNSSTNKGSSGEGTVKKKSLLSQLMDKINAKKTNILTQLYEFNAEMHLKYPNF